MLHEESNFLFVTGMIRSGTTLLGFMLDAHPEVTIAQDPYMPFYKSLRNAAVQSYGNQALRQSFDQNQPFSDGYFSHQEIQILDILYNLDLDIPFDYSERYVLHEQLASRMSHESPDLIEYLPNIHGNTYKEWLLSGFNAIADSRGTSTWIGTKEVWSIDFVTSIARSFPQSKFILIIRDPRAIIASIVASRTKYPDQVAHTLSVIRHWRKQVASAILVKKYLKNHFWILRYEDLINQPENHARLICDFLQLDFSEDMINPSMFRYAHNNQPWRGNSSFLEDQSFFDQRSSTRWRYHLPKEVWQSIEFLSQHDMRICDYTCDFTNSIDQMDPETLFYLYNESLANFNWRSDFRDIQQDIGYELFRQFLCKNDCHYLDHETLRKSFLYLDVYDVISRDQRVEYAMGEVAPHVRKGDH
jgi:hypothetical protein